MDIKTYRKKPVEVQGVLFEGTNDAEVAAFVGTSYAHPVKRENDQPGSNWLPAHHGQGAKVWNTSQHAWNDVNVGDTILRGLVGEFYPCSPDALAATYAEVSE
jgi:hypothetical protein